MNRIFTPAILFALALPFAISAQGVYQLWGTTAYGGPSNTGTIFSLDLDGNKFTNRHNFLVQNNGRPTSSSRLVEYNGKFYGTTVEGGFTGDGVLFEWDPVTNIYTTKIDFNNDRGSFPGNLLLYNGKFYGTTYYGGLNAGGVLFEYDPATNAYIKKVEFSFIDGAQPASSLTLKDGKIYGTTENGGVNNSGVLFEFDPSTSIYTRKLELQSATGTHINGVLALYANKFYGVGFTGGTGNYGVLFEWDPVTNIYTVKYQFGVSNPTDGNPFGSLTIVGNKLYGKTFFGGASFAGVIFEYDPVNNIYLRKYELSSTDGMNPYADLELVSGKLYGTTSEGGVNNLGTIFEYDPATSQFTKKIDLTNSTGTTPRGNLVVSNNKLYGMTSHGGGKYNGTIFEYDPSVNNYTRRLDLTISDGMFPVLRLAHNNGKLLGITSSGGSGLMGALYEFDPANSRISKQIDIATANGVIPSLTSSSNGVFPSSSLVEMNGNYYGMTLNGGTNGMGTIFVWNTTTNTFTKKLDLPVIIPNPGPQPVDAAFIPPLSTLVPYNNKFIGIINRGGVDHIGSIIEYDPATNNFTYLKDFSLIDGGLPYPSLDSFNGKFYGTTHRGGANNEGTIFEWNPVTNTFTKKIDLNVGTEGSRPLGGLVLLNNKFYGVTYSGGLNDKGVLFEYDPVANIYTKKKDAAASDFGISKPFGRLVKDGYHLFGLAAEGGDNNKGAVFEWRPPVDSFIVNHSFIGTDGYTLFENELLGFNEMTIGQAPIAEGTPGACESYTYPSPINAANFNSWIPLTDARGDVIAELRANGNTLGTLNYSLFKNDGTLRIEYGVRAYLDRQLVITPQFQPTTPVDIRIYGTREEFERVRHATDSIGQPHGWFTDFDDFNDLRIIKRTGANCTATIPPQTPPEIPEFPYSTAEAYGADGYVIKFSVSSFSTIYIVNFSAIPLPVKLLSFNGKTAGADAELEWKTVNESNLKHFVLERSLNGKDFVPAGTVAAINDPADHEYKFIDKQIQSLGVSRLYYRLLQQDIDGKAVYSRVIVLTLNGKGNTAMVYPNPVQKELGIMVNLHRAQSIKWSITDNSGRSIKQGSLFITSGSTNTNINISNLAPGVYYLSMEGEQVSQKLKFLKQ